MITYKTGNIFNSDALVLVNPVNTVGVMGKGLALEFKRRYPRMFKVYRRLCSLGLLTVGNPWLWSDAFGFQVLLFPTKEHWRRPSEVSYIENGLQIYVGRVLGKFGKDSEYDEDSGYGGSIAFPALGCGLGGLDFKTQVKPLMEKYLSDLPVDVEIWLPN